MKREKKIRFAMPAIIVASFLISGCGDFLQTMDSILRISEEPKKSNPNFLQWVKTIGIGWQDSGNAIACDADNNVYVAGNFAVFADFDTSANKRDYRRTAKDGSDIFLTSVDKYKNYRWTNTIISNAVDDEGNTIKSALEIATGVVTDSASSGIASIYVVGCYDHAYPISINGEQVTPPAGGAGKEVFISKFKEDGTYSWTKTIGGNDDDTPINVKTDAWGNVYILGHFKSDSIDFDPNPHTQTFALISKTSSKTYEDPFVLKLSPEGNYVWAITFDSSEGTNVFGYTTGFVCADLAVDVDGNVFIVGAFAANKDFDPNKEFPYMMTSANNGLDMFVLKLDSNKGFLWARQFGKQFLDVATSVALDKTGNIYVAGITQDEQSASLLVVMKLDNNGNELWDPWKEVLSPLFFLNSRPDTDALDSAASRPQLRVDANGKIYVVGRFANGDINFGSFGITAWNQDLTAASAGFKYYGEWDPFLIRINSGGVFEWVRTFGGASDDSAYGIAVDGESSVYLTGRFDSTDIDFNPDLKAPHTAVVVPAVAGSPDAFIVKFSPQP